MPLTLIASVGLDNELGRDGDLCWHIPEDLKHFKETTMGASVIMGRKTWESLPRKPLPGRTNIVITSSSDYAAEGATVVHSLAEALKAAGDAGKFIIGGESIYREALPLASTLELTRIEANDPEADKFFPHFDTKNWKLTKISESKTSPDGIHFRYETYENRDHLPQ